MRGGAQGDQLKNRRNSTCYGPSAILMAPRPNIWRPSPLTDLLPTAHHLAEEPRTGPDTVSTARRDTFGGPVRSPVGRAV